MESGPDEHAPPRPPFRGPPASPPSVDFWQLAGEGDTDRAYHGLKERLDREPRREEVYLQLYWLLTVCPAVDPDRSPVDWLYKGLNACGESGHRVCQRLRGEAAANPQMALDENFNRPDILLSRGASTARLRPNDEELVLSLAVDCWRAARSIDRYDVILSDLDAFHAAAALINPDARAIILLTAVELLVWADRKGRTAVPWLRKEIDSLSHLTHDVSDDLFRVEYAEFRPTLLAFCVREMISPLSVLPVFAGRDEFTVPQGPHLAHAVSSDWPLLHVYQGYAAFHGPE